MRFMRMTEGHCITSAKKSEACSPRRALIAERAGDVLSLILCVPPAYGVAGMLPLLSCPLA